jgi:hypothetical protein
VQHPATGGSHREHRGAGQPSHRDAVRRLIYGDATRAL